jgi:hypothetical protein
MPAVGELVRCTDGRWMIRPPAVPAETALPLKEIGHATDVDAKDLANAAEWFY